MSGRWRRVAFVAVLVCLSAVVAVVLGRGSSDTPNAAKYMAAKNAAAFIRAREGRRGGQEVADSAAAAAYARRAFPAKVITFDEQQHAAHDAENGRQRHSKLSSGWEALGPSTLNVDRLGTQTYQRPTQWSGRQTAMAVDPKCGNDDGCTLYIGAAGGGVWRTKNALDRKPDWTFISDDIPTNAIGSIVIDPNDRSGRTLYVGTGEGNGSGDSEVGVGVYRSKDGGSHWAALPGSLPVSAQKTIPALAVDPSDPNHILIGTRSGVTGLGSNACCESPPGAPASGLFESHDGGATFTSSRLGSTYEIRFDPRNPSTVYAAAGRAGLLRSTAGGAAGSWESIFSSGKSRFTFAVTVKGGKTRIYLADSEPGSQAYRLDDASLPAAALTAGGNAAWKRLSNPVDGTPGYASYGYCEGQCIYDMFIGTPAGQPDMIVLGGLMNYGELPPYCCADRSNGRSVLLSKDGGETWTDATGDVAGESMHPDQHTVGFVPGNPDQFFVGSDGGIIRTNGTYSDASGQCSSRNLTGVDLTDCQAWLKRIPSKLEPMNAGLSTLQLYSISVNPKRSLDEAMSGTQDNGTISYSGSSTWRLGLTGDGGDSGFDAVDPTTRFHTYYFGWMDVNFQGDKPETWVWVADPMFFSTEAFDFYPPTIADPVRGGSIFVGGEHVWRTQDSGGNRAYLEAHCNTTNQFGTSDQLFSGNCGDFQTVGPSLTDPSHGDRAGGDIIAMDRGTDGGTLWAATTGARVFVSRNANATPSAVSFTRIDSPATPERVPTSVNVDPTNPNHAVITYNGYGATTPAAPGHVFDVRINAAGVATWKDISYDIGDQPIVDAVYDAAGGDIYVSTDFGVWRLAAGSTTWTVAAGNLPVAQFPGLTLVKGKDGSRLLYAASHGRGAYRLAIKANEGQNGDNGNNNRR